MLLKIKKSRKELCPLTLIIQTFEKLCFRRNVCKQNQKRNALHWYPALFYVTGIRKVYINWPVVPEGLHQLSCCTGGSITTDLLYRRVYINWPAVSEGLYQLTCCTGGSMLILFPGWFSIPHNTFWKTVQSSSSSFKQWTATIKILWNLSGSDLFCKLRIRISGGYMYK